MKKNNLFTNANTLSYKEYRAMIETLLQMGRTTGEDQSESKLEITKLNVTRMKRLDKTIETDLALIDSLKKMGKQTWYLITEAWCGDAAQCVPVISKLAEESEQVDLKILLRDEYPEIMNEYLTNGSRSIPKLIALNEEREELFHWGPRPVKIQEEFLQLKESVADKNELMKQLHMNYTKDKGRKLQDDLKSILSAKN